MYLMYLRLCQELSMPVAIEKSAAWVRAGLHPKNYGYPLLSCKKSPLSSNPGWARGQPPRGNTFSPLHSTASLHHGCPVTAPSCHASSLMPLRHIMHNATSPKASRALVDHLQLLLTRAVYPLTSSTYKAGCNPEVLKHVHSRLNICLPPQQDTPILSRCMWRLCPISTSPRLSSPTSSNFMLSLVIQGIERSQDRTHLQPRRRPLTNVILDQMLGLRTLTPWRLMIG